MRIARSVAWILLAAALSGCSDNPVFEVVKQKVDIYTGNVPKISIKFEGITVQNGDTIPPLVNSYLGNPTPRKLAFTIENTGDQDLHLTSAPTILVEPAVDYRMETIDAPSSVTIPPSQNAAFSITFDPQSIGTKLALLTVQNDDPKDGTYKIMLTGKATAIPEPEIHVMQGSTEIQSGVTPYAFGNVIFDGSAGTLSTAVFTISNNGTKQLTLSNVDKTGSDLQDFILHSNYSSPVAAGNSTTFSVDFDPLNIANGKTVTITIYSDDPEHPAFSFPLTGNGTQWVGPSASATTSYGDRVEVSWPSQPYAERYDVYRSGVLITSCTPPTVLFTDTLATAGYPCVMNTIYTYAIRSSRLLSTTPVSSSNGVSANGKRTGYYHHLGYIGGFGALNGQFDGVLSVAIDGSNNIYACQDGHYISGNYPEVQVFDQSGTYLRKWGSEGTGDGKFTKSPGPKGMVYSSYDDRIYVADTGNHRVQRFTTTGTFEGWFGYDGTNTGWHAPASGKTGVAGAGNGQFNGPAGITCSSEKLLVSDTGNNRIQYFWIPNLQDQAQGYGFISAFGSFGSGNQNFNSPMGIAADTNHVYVADKGNSRIQKILYYNSTWVTRWGTRGSGSSQFYDPTGICISSGSPSFLYIVDPGSCLVKKFQNPVATSPDPSTYINQFGTYGTSQGQFHTPLDIEIDSNGILYVAEYHNNRIERFKWE